jgi:hypothetical protein
VTTSTYYASQPPYNNNNNKANAGTGDIGTVNSNDRIAATVYSLGTWFVSGAKDDGGDDDDDDNNNYYYY